jgi:sialate O-acetylesterase
MMKNLKLSIVALILLFTAGQISTSFAEVKPAKIFSSNMVLQQGIENTIWGWADKNEKITISINGKEVKTHADKEGKWAANLPSMEYGGPYTMTISGKNQVQFTNVMIGEVWVCSGQSNMEFPVSGVINAKEEIANADFPKIRLFTVPKKVSQKPVADLEAGEWVVCSPASVAEFSAVGYFFGRKIHKDLDVAVGLINTSWGGTVAETWISSETIKKDSDFVESWNELQKADLANYETSLKERINSVIVGLPNKDNGLELNYNKATFDDSNWKTIRAPKLWEEQGYRGFNGIAWYRKSIILDKNQAESGIVLSLGKIDDYDVCWVNGVEVGKTNLYTIDRIYKVPATILKEGENIIVLKIIDEGGGGGLYSPAKDVYLTSGDRKISLAGDWKIKFTEVMPEINALNPNDYPTLLYNGMVSPIVPYGIKGAIWYQGESNAEKAKQYQRVFPNLITDWRNHWQIGDFPFFWVQLANFKEPVENPSESTWAELREAQTMTLKLPNTGMASAIDIGDAIDIHPKNKQDVGKRLALNALKVAYRKDILCAGPTYQSMKTDGSKVNVSFSNTGSGLKVNNKYGYINGFSLAGADGKFFWAEGTLLNNNTVVLHSKDVQAPVAVRYGWADNPDDLNLYNSEGLPAIPFRTDDWPGITQ